MNDITQPEMDFSFTDVHSPEPASKFIERSLHDIDDIINVRRLQLSDLKRKRLQSPPFISSSEKPQSQFSSPQVRIIYTC